MGHRLINPTRIAKPFGKSGNKNKPRVFMFGIKDDGTGWHPRYAPRQLDQTLASLGITEILVPEIEGANRKVAYRSSFQDVLGKTDMSVTVRSGSKSNAVLIGERKRGVAMFVDNEPIAVFSFPSGRTITAVCSRDTMLDRTMVLNQPRASLRQVLGNSIVSTVLKKSDLWEPAERVQAYFALGLSQASCLHAWNDHENGAYNKNLTMLVEERFPNSNCFDGYDIIEGRLNLFNLFKAQCTALGMREDNIICDGWAVDEPNLDHDQRRKWCNKPGTNNRNLLISVTL